MCFEISYMYSIHSILCFIGIFVLLYVCDFLFSLSLSHSLYIYIYIYIYIYLYFVCKLYNSSIVPLRINIHIVYTAKKILDFLFTSFCNSPANECEDRTSGNLTRNSVERYNIYIFIFIFIRIDSIGII